jgi:aspartyl-tRNA(Asn)/glutamyl-tRNA(Gln) amidotransferase subunit C
MSIDRPIIEKTAKLANLELSDTEKDEFTHQISDILDYVEKINQLDTSKVTATDHIADLKNVFREDKVQQSIDLSEITKMSPQFEDNHFVVPKIIESES